MIWGEGGLPLLDRTTRGGECEENANSRAVRYQMKTTYEISVASLTGVVSFCAGQMGRLVEKDCEGSGSPPCRLGGATLSIFKVGLLCPQESLYWVLCPLPIPLAPGIKGTREEDMGSFSLRMGTGDEASEDVLQRP